MRTCRIVFLVVGAICLLLGLVTPTENWGPHIDLAWRRGSTLHVHVSNNRGSVELYKDMDDPPGWSVGKMPDERAAQVRQHGGTHIATAIVTRRWARLELPNPLPQGSYQLVLVQPNGYSLGLTDVTGVVRSAKPYIHWRWDGSFFFTLALLLFIAAGLCAAVRSKYGPSLSRPAKLAFMRVLGVGAGPARARNLARRRRSW